MSIAIPEGYQSVTPIIVFRDTRKALDFYKKAFGAIERYAVPGPGGKGIMHAEFQIGSSIIMTGEESEGMPHKSAQTMGGSPISFYIYLDNVDLAFERAVSAGCTVQMPLSNMFWGDRAGAVNDPFGYNWFLASRIEVLSQEQIAKRAQAAMAEMSRK